MGRLPTVSLAATVEGEPDRHEFIPSIGVAVSGLGSVRALAGRACGREVGGAQRRLQAEATELCTVTGNCAGRHSRKHAGKTGSSGLLPHGEVVWKHELAALSKHASQTGRGLMGYEGGSSQTFARLSRPKSGAQPRMFGVASYPAGETRRLRNWKALTRRSPRALSRECIAPGYSAPGARTPLIHRNLKPLLHLFLLATASAVAHGEVKPCELHFRSH